MGRIRVRSLLAAACGALAAAQAAADKPVIDFVNMGGNDCPPCIAWRATELPKLQAMPEFRDMRYWHVVKSVPSTVPPGFFFPSEIKHLQPLLKEASSGATGSPQQAIVVNGKVVDYWFGTGKGDAADLAAMVRAIQQGKPLPRRTCLQLETSRSCKTPGPAKVAATS